MELSEIKGLKAKRIEKLNAAGFFKPEELLFYFPHCYIDRDAPINFSRLRDGDSLSFIGSVDTKPMRKFVRKGLSFVKVKMTVQGGAVNCVWFNQPYIFTMLIANKSFCISGKVKHSGSAIELTSPFIRVYNGDDRRIIPVYKTLAGLPQNTLTEAIKIVLDSTKISGFLTDEVIRREGLLGFDESVRIMHNPPDINSVITASKSMAMEKLCSTISTFKALKNKRSTAKLLRYDTSKLSDVNSFIDSLPFKLTPDQSAAVDVLIDAMNSPAPMNKLIQGDVGCGKTVVAFAAMYYAVLSGHSCALMAPTEILAKQHYLNALKLFEPLNIQVAFLSGGLTKSARDTVLFNIKHGISPIVIGTHSLISDDVEFKSLALVITDEQQRFGVVQRGALENKSGGADNIVMSATPIPRTLALTLYGDLEHITIKTLPLMRPKILTRIVPQGKLLDMMNYIKQNAEQDKRTYIVCPKIDEGDGDDENGGDSVTQLYKKYSEYFGLGITGLLHGRMKEKEKSEIMRSFADGTKKILFATTIIEVGIDVPQAVNIIIFGADRFGLSQLHQLRGRVGRGTEESYCFVVSDEFEDEAKQRLDYFVKSGDGFELAEYDFKLRGAGDFLGERQHGDNGFDSLISVEMLTKAKEISEYLLSIPRISNELFEKISKNEQNYLYSLTLN